MYFEGHHEGAITDFHSAAFRAMQFYNQNPSPGYDDCDTLLNTGGSSVLRIQQSGVDLQEVVIGKPSTIGDPTNRDPTKFVGCI
ncbi:hypothetical protein C8Q74DRAFT_1373777 [Fomes fomentarius]|nr:hypothetical protein C8Q74DRAFT_1373777 [Fomes fomentarius]